MIGDNIVTRGLSNGVQTLAIRGFHALRVFASKGFYPIWKLFGRGRLEGKIELTGMKSFSVCGVYKLEGVKSFSVEKVYSLLGMKAFRLVNEPAFQLVGVKQINVHESALNIEGTKSMKLSESIDIIGKKDLSPILTALDII